MEGREVSNLNLFDVFSLGFGGAVGAGIFVLTGLAIQATGRSVILAVVCAVIFMVLANFFSILLASMFKLTGGDYSQKALLFNPLMTGLTGYLNFIFACSIAMYAIAIVQYGSMIFPQIKVYDKWIEIAIISFFFLTTIRGSKFMSQVNNVMTIILMGALGLFICFGLPEIDYSHYFTNEPFFKHGFTGFISAVALMSFACQGITQGPISVATVTRDSLRTIPKAMGLVALALAFFYGFITLVASGVLPTHDVAGKNLSLVAQAIFPHWVFVAFVLAGAVFAIATSLMSMITMVRYPILKVAQDGWLPGVFSKTTQEGYPYVIYGVYYLIAICPILFNLSLDVLVSAIMIPLMLMNVYLNIACLKMIKDYPRRWQQSILHMPKPCIYLISALATAASAVVCYQLFVGLTSFQKILMVVVSLALYIFAYVRIKAGHVDLSKLEAERQEILIDLDETIG
nr:APC family permease [Vaginisenegalia massiliensis]